MFVMMALVRAPSSHADDKQEGQAAEPPVSEEDIEARLTCPEKAEPVVQLDGERGVSYCVRGGLRHGPWTRWDSGGARFSFGGKAVGSVEYGPFYKVEEGEYRLGKRVGTWSRWSDPPSSRNREPRRLLSRTSYQNDVQNGRVEKWYPSGIKSSDELVRNGVCESATFWDESGTVRQEIRGGVQTYYYADHQKEKEGPTKNCGEKQVGPWTFWHPNGALAAKGAFVNNNPAGKWTHWYENGNKKSEGYYDSSGNEKGEWNSWREDGSRESTQQHQSAGVERYWYEDGKRSRENRTTVGGYPCGTVSCWNEDGEAEPCGEWRDLRDWARSSLCEMTATGAKCRSCR